METSRTASTYDKYCCDLFKVIFEKKREENVFISPFSIAAALAMTHLGAKEATAQGIEEALGWQSDEGSQRHEEFQAFLTSLKTRRPNDKYRLSIANRIYIQQGYEILEEFKTNTSKHYLTGEP